MKIERHNPIPERKIKAVKEIAELVKNKKTTLIASIKNLPASQYQEIGKKLRGKAIIKVPKKNILFRGIDASGNEGAKQLKECFENSISILFSDLDSYELAGELLKSKSPAKAKPGQEAPEDIEIQAGPTDLLPGPAISELGAVGLQIQIEKGKITIKDSRVIVKKGQEISQAAADIMNKLDIKPFLIGFTPLCAFDNETKKLYREININPEEAVADLKDTYRKTLSFAVEIGYFNSDTINFLLGKAGMHEKALLTLVNVETKDSEETEPKAKVSESVGSEPKEEAAVEPEEKKEVSEKQTQTPEPKGNESEESGEEK